MRKTLACFLSAGLVAGAFASSPGFAWIESDEDLLSGGSNHYKFIVSPNAVGNSIGVDENPILTVRCRVGKGLEVSVTTPTFNGRNNRVAVRWDEGGPQSQTWLRSSAGTGFFSKNPRGFLDKLIQNDRLVFGWDPYQRAQEAVAFNLTSEKEDLNKMIELCGLTPKADKPKSSNSTRPLGRDR